MAAKPPNDWWKVSYHTNQMTRTGGQSVPGVAYVEAPDAATAKKKVEAQKGLQPAEIDSVSGPMNPHAKDMAVGGNPVTGTVNVVKSAIPNAFSLVFGNTTGLLLRALKVIFGGILITAGVIKLSGADKTLNQVLPLVGGPVGKVLKV